MNSVRVKKGKKESKVLLHHWSAGKVLDISVLDASPIIFKWRTFPERGCAAFLPCMYSALPVTINNRMPGLTG